MGTFRDIHRHRMCSIYNVHIYAYRWDEVRGEQNYSERIYSATLGTRVRFTLHINLRELIHLIELRSQKAGHFDYKEIWRRNHDRIY